MVTFAFCTMCVSFIGAALEMFRIYAIRGAGDESNKLTDIVCSQPFMATQAFFHYAAHLEFPVSMFVLIAFIKILAQAQTHQVKYNDMMSELEGSIGRVDDEELKTMQTHIEHESDATSMSLVRLPTTPRQQKSRLQ